MNFTIIIGNFAFRNGCEKYEKTLARFNYDVRISMIVYSVFKPFILSMCVTNSYTIGSPSTDSSIELVFAPRNEALKCELTNIVIVTLCIKVFYFLDLKN